MKTPWHYVRLRKSYPEDLVQKASRKGNLMLQRGSLERVPIKSSIYSIIKTASIEKQESLEKTELMIDLLHKMFEYSPNKRISPEGIINHALLQRGIGDPVSIFTQGLESLAIKESS